MQAVLRWLSLLVGRWPLAVLAALALVTAALAPFAAQAETSAELTRFAPESETQLAFERVQQDFAGESLNVVVIVEAADGGSVLSPEGLQAAAQIESEVAALDLPVEEQAARPGGGTGQEGTAPGDSPVQSFAQPFLAAGLDPQAADDQRIGQVVRQVVSEQPQAAMLLSRDFDRDTAEASAGLVIVPLGLRVSTVAGGGAATEEELQRAEDLSQRVADAAETAESPALNVIPFNDALLSAELEGGITDELPMLLGASLVLVVLILVFTFRSIVDVLFGFAGLIVAVLWTFGISALLGPGFLDITGPFSQIATAVPVLIVGLGIDYAIHLTGRYREEQEEGAAPDRAASRAVVTVGAALVLATITVLVGFLTNLLSPLPPLRDFGIFVSAGVLAAFVIFTLGIPSARSLLDRSRGRTPAGNPANPGDEGNPDSEDNEGNARQSRGGGGFSGPMGRAAALSERAPLAVVAVTVVITVLAAIAATQVDTTFEITDFIPEDSRAGRAFTALEQHFGGDLTERTYVLVDADMTDPAVANAMLEVEQQLGEVESVQSAGGAVQSISPASLVAQVAMSVPQDEAAALGWTGEGFAPDAQMERLYGLVEEQAPGRLAAVLGEDRQAALVSIPTVAGQDGAMALADALRPRLEPLAEAGAETTITSQNLVLQQTLDALTESQVRGIGITLGAALLLLVVYYGVSGHRPILGVATMLPSLLVTVWAVGTMWLLGLTFNVLTVMVSALAIGIGVPYGIHVTNRFLEEVHRETSVDAAIRRTMRGTGGALAGSAATTAAGFGVLVLSSLTPLRQFGLIVAMVIIYSLAAATLVEPTVLKYWARARHVTAGPEPAAQPSREPGGPGGDGR